ncbi:MAG: hypothetical protein JWN30_318 [Bacilli bacterium]|nr:hypothetical protein [Bacilli bacterium]
MEILNITVPKGDYSDLIVCIGAALIALFFLFLLTFGFSTREYTPSVLCGVLFALCTLVSFGSFLEYHAPKPVKYEVLIQDMSKFDATKYKIDDRRGKIYVIEEANQ